MILDPLSFVPLEVERRTAELSRLARPRPDRPTHDRPTRGRLLLDRLLRRRRPPAPDASRHRDASFGRLA